MNPRNLKICLDFVYGKPLAEIAAEHGMSTGRAHAIKDSVLTSLCFSKSARVKPDPLEVAVAIHNRWSKTPDHMANTPLSFYFDLQYESRFQPIESQE